MKIVTTKCKTGYNAEMVDWLISPPTGHGKTPSKAIASLFFKLFHPPSQSLNWVRNVDFDDFSIINRFRLDGDEYIDYER